ncbi:hypothetical protein EMCRGX_G004876 [Ephydatia muelleri]
MTAPYYETRFNVSAIDVCTFTNGSPLPTALTSFQGSFLIVTFIASIVVNVFFTVVVISQKALHQRDLVLNMLLAVLHIIIGLVANLSHLISLITGSWVFGMPACYLVGNAIFFIGLMRYVLILVITVDRFGEIMYPFKYPQHAKKVIAVVILIGTLFSLMLTLVFNLDTEIGCYNFDHSFHSCFIQIQCKTAGCYAFAMAHEDAPIIATHVRIIGARAQHQHHRKVVPDSSSASLQPVVTGVLLLVSLVILTTPLQLYFTVRIFIQIDTSLEQVSTFAVLSGILHYLIPIADGLVVMRNRNVKACLAAMGRKLVCCCCRQSNQK